MIAGCLRIAKESIFTGLNNFKVNTISDIKFARYFGFTDDEVKDILKYYELDEAYARIKEWHAAKKATKWSADEITRTGV